MIKIAFVVSSLDNKGPVIVVKNLVDYLTSQGVYCKVFFFDDIKELQFSCQITQIKMTDFKAIKGFDIIHTHGIRPDLYSFLNSNIKIKRISTVHQYIKESFQLNNGYSRIKSIFLEFVWNVMLLRNDVNIVITKSALSHYKKIFFNTRIEYIYNGVNVNKKALDMPEQKQIETLKNKGMKIMGACAVLTRIKGLNQIIEILPHFKNIIFIVLGDGKEKDNLIKLSKKLKVSDRCLFLGYKSNVNPYLNIFDFYAIPSYSEAFGLALIEATANKKASLVSDIETFRELFTDKEVVFAKLDNKESMISAINQLIEGKNGYEKNGYQKYKASYTLDVMGKNYLDAYTQLLISK